MQSELKKKSVSVPISQATAPNESQIEFIMDKADTLGQDGGIFTEQFNRRIMKTARHLFQKTFILLLALGLLQCMCFAQQKETLNAINAGPFADAAHHWYDIYEKTNVIFPKRDQPRYQNTQLTEIGDNILLYQKDNGGWPKNYDIFAILTPEQEDSLIRAKSVLNTTFDNGTSYTHVAALSQIYSVTNETRFREAALKGIDYILSAQYKNGGWPQYFPLEKNYSRHITYNDGAMIGILQVLKDIVDGKPQYAFVDGKRLEKVKRAYEKGLDCTISLQINDLGKPTAWCQQYDEVTLQPAWARKFEAAFHLQW